jgi:hypothetical protein
LRTNKQWALGTLIGVLLLNPAHSSREDLFRTKQYVSLRGCEWSIMAPAAVKRSKESGANSRWPSISCCCLSPALRMLKSRQTERTMVSSRTPAGTAAAARSLQAGVELHYLDVIWATAKLFGRGCASPPKLGCPNIADVLLLLLYHCSARTGDSIVMNIFRPWQPCRCLDMSDALHHDTGYLPSF